MKKNSFSYLISSFLTEHLTGIRNLSINTVSSYRDTIVKLLMYLDKMQGIRPERVTIEDINRNCVLSFLDWIEENGASVSTRNQRLAAIRSFFRFISYNYPEYMFQVEQILSIPAKKIPKKVVNFLDESQTKKLLSTPDMATKKGLRDGALLCLLYDTGCRAQELADIKVKDIVVDKVPQVKLQGKGNKARTIPISKNAASIVKKYMKAFGLNTIDKRDSPLFFNSKGDALTRQGITYILQKYCEKCDMKIQVSPHTLRHSKAMHLTEADVNPVYIRDFLGHSDFKTTQIYAKSSVEMKRKALEKLESNIPKSESEQPSRLSNTNDWTSDRNLMDWLTSLGK